VRNEKLGYKIREAQVDKVPVIAVVGEREAQAGTVAPRTGPGAGEVVEVGEFVARCAAAARMPGGAP
jgi:threonyl-tRNA synthetase